MARLIAADGDGAFSEKWLFLLRLPPTPILVLKKIEKWAPIREEQFIGQWP